MQGLVFSDGIVRLGEIFVAPLALVASITLAGCSGASGGGTAPGDDGSSAGDDAASTSLAGDDADTIGSGSGQSASSSGSNSGGGSNAAQDVDSGGGSAATRSSSGASTGGPGAATDAGSPDASSGGSAKADAGAGSSGGSSSGSSGGSSGSAGGTPPASTATFTQVFNSILGPACSSCHGIAAPMMSFNVKATAYTDLVGVVAQGSGCGSSGETRGGAGSSATSLLYMKVAGTQTCGVRMPQNRTPLSAANIALIKNWIDQGAMNN